MSSILVVEDEDRIASFLTKGLESHGFTVTRIADGLSAVDYALTGDFDLVVLDIGLPGLDGFEVLEQVGGQRPDLPVIVLTARDSVTDTVAALEGGAVDYMSKPFRFDELLARIRLRLRTSSSTAPSEDVLTSRRLHLDLRRRVLAVEGREEELSAREFRLAEVFLRNPGQVLTREQLLSQVWGYDFDPGSNVVDVYVGYLRKKVGAATITTVRGVGYRFEP